MTHVTRLALPLSLVGLVLATPVQAEPRKTFELRPTQAKVGDAWSVRMSTRVERDPAVDRAAGRSPVQEFAETTSRVDCKVLRQDEDGRVQLQARYAPQTVLIAVGGEQTREEEPERTVTTWGQAEDLLGAEVGPASLAARERTHVGDTWTTDVRLPVGGLATIPMRFTYRVTAAKRDGDAPVLRVTCEGVGLAEADDGSRVQVQARGVLHLRPDQVDRPKKAVLVYRFRISGGGQPDVATRTTVRLETRQSE
jgi:hypothetical protein